MDGETDGDKIIRYEHIFEYIIKIISRIPPVYAYGDNEAGCYMANMLQEIENIIENETNIFLR